MRLLSCESLVPCLLFFLNSVIIETTEGTKIGNALAGMTSKALQTLLNELGVKYLDKVRSVIPLYRDDLPSDHVAYYEVTTTIKYYIISTGPKTGDYDMSRYGATPSQTEHVRADAKIRGVKCDKFFVMNHRGDLMCTDKEGKFVATSRRILLPGKEVNKTIDSFIRSHTQHRADMWRQHAQRVLKQTDDMKVNENERAAEQEMFIATEIIPGVVQPVAVGSMSNIKEVRVRYVISGPDGSRNAGLKDHKKLCAVIRGCDISSANERYATLSAQHIALHELYIDLELLAETEDKYNSIEFVFILDIVRNDGSTTTYNFGASYPTRRQKRYTNDKDFWNIYRPDLFPDYNKDDINDNCDNYSPPVSWAMVFGYYDRYSQMSGCFEEKLSRHLYRDGHDGTYGDWRRVAPDTSYSDPDRIWNYIQKLAEILEIPDCDDDDGDLKFGHMKRVSKFYEERQLGWNVKLIGFSGKYVSHNLRHRLQAHWPVIVGWRNDALKPVATALRSKESTYRHCTEVCFIWCWKDCEWKTKTVYHVFYRPGGHRHSADFWLTSSDVDYAVYAHYQ